MKDQRLDEIIKNKIENREFVNASKTQIDKVMFNLGNKNKNFIASVFYGKLSLLILGFAFLLVGIFIFNRYDVSVTQKQVNKSKNSSNELTDALEINRNNSNKKLEVLSTNNNEINVINVPQFESEKILNNVNPFNNINEITNNSSIDAKSQKYQFTNKYNKNQYSNESNVILKKIDSTTSINNQNIKQSYVNNLQEFKYFSNPHFEVNSNVSNDNFENNKNEANFEFHTIKKIPFTQINSINKFTISQIPIIFQKIEPKDDAPISKFSLGISSSLAENYKGFGLNPAYDLNKHFTIFSGINTRFYKEIEYENSEAFSIENNAAFANYYGLKSLSSGTKEIEIRKQNFAIPLSLQYNRIISKEFYGIGSLGINVNLAENHLVVYELSNENRKQKLSKFIKPNNLVDFNFGIGVEKRLKNFRLHFIQYYTFNNEHSYKGRKHHQNALSLDIRAFYNFSR